jgi:acetate---CoA ligase (ADP-forming)
VLCTLDEERYFRDTLGVAPFHFPEDAVQALAFSRDLAARRAVQEPAASPPLTQTDTLAQLLAAPGAFLSLEQALAVIQALGIPLAPWEAAATPPEATAAAARVGFPVVLKLSAPSLIHKTEAGGIILDLNDAAAVETAFNQLAEVARANLPPREAWRVVVMSQVAGGQEVLLGARRDDSFGPVIAVGAGGVDTEILDDVALRVAPVSPAQALDLIAETRIGRILAGTRGRPPADLDSLSQALAALSQLLLQFPQVQEVDLNPVRVFPGKAGLVALDARIRITGH